jgi:hypothetical protein
MLFIDGIIYRRNLPLFKISVGYLGNKPNKNPLKTLISQRTEGLSVLVV